MLEESWKLLVEAYNLSFVSLFSPSPDLIQHTPDDSSW